MLPLQEQLNAAMHRKMLPYIERSMPSFIGKWMLSYIHIGRYAGINAAIHTYMDELKLPHIDRCIDK